MKNVKIIISLIFITLIVGSCNIENNNKDKNVQGKEDKALIKKAYYDNGNLKSEITFKNKSKNGPAKRYYTTGELHTVVHYVKNTKEGEAVWYYKSGKPYRITQYENNKIEGVRKLFYEDGTLMAEIPYKNNKPQIGLKEYNKNGKLLTNYPHIIFNTNNLIIEQNLYIITFQLSNHSKKVMFYQELKGTDGKERLFEIPTKNGIGKLEFHIPSRVKDSKTITIYAQMKTSMGNPYIIKDSYTFSFDTY
ncbi:MAG: hypothetical protein U9P82_08170, partial [Bacteroidota bacterium]|nr:hypothetical protein [Bacteroidota bacterium]